MTDLFKISFRFIFIYLNDVFSSSDYTVSNSRPVSSKEPERNWKETVVS